MNKVARYLARAWLTGTWTLPGLQLRTIEVLGRTRLSHGLHRLTLGFWLELRHSPQARRLKPLTAAISAHADFRRIEHYLKVTSLPTAPGAMAEAPGDWQLPQLPTLGSLAAFLQVDACDLRWLEDPARLADHYQRYWHGTRLIEAPKRQLKRIQQRLHVELFQLIPPHDAAHGFRRQRSVLSAVQAHAGQEVLLVCDLRSFFPSIRASRIHSLCQRSGYPEDVARSLTRLCTTACRQLPSNDAQPAPDWQVLRHYKSPHLPQGAPTSPGLANLCAYRLDSRLTGLAASFDARYTRYADDLIFSGKSKLQRPSYRRLIQHIVEAEGFTLNPDKTRSMTSSMRQQVLGVVLNERPTLPRRELKTLEAILYNCVRHGPRTQQRGTQGLFRDQLAGRVAWAQHIDPKRAERVTELFASIDWTRDAEPH